MLIILKEWLIPILVGFLVGGLGSDSFVTRELCSRYLDDLIYSIDSPMYLTPYLNSKDLEQKTRCRRIFRKQTADMLAEVGEVRISLIKKEYIKFWTPKLKSSWKYRYQTWTTDNYNGKDDLNVERGREFINLYVEEGCSRRSLNYLYKSMKHK